MKKIETALLAKSNAVLTNDENKVIAIIECENTDSVTEKVCLAIKEDYIAKEVNIVEANGIFDNQRPFSFTAELIDEDDEVLIYDFELTICATY